MTLNEFEGRDARNPLAGAAEGKEKWGSNTLMASAGARAYNGGLGTEPRAGVQGAEPAVEVKGAKPPAADEVFVFKTVILNASATVLHKMLYSLYCLSCFFCKVSK